MVSNAGCSRVTRSHATRRICDRPQALVATNLTFSVGFESSATGAILCGNHRLRHAGDPRPVVAGFAGGAQQVGTQEQPRATLTPLRNARRMVPAAMAADTSLEYRSAPLSFLTQLR